MHGRLTVIVAAVVTALAIPVKADSPLLQTLKKWDEPKIGKAVTASGFKFTVGHASFELTDGTVAGVFGEGGERLGLFLSGAGTWSYQSADPDEFTAFRYNARSADLKLTESDRSLVLRQPFTSALLLGTDLPDVPAGEAGGLPATFDAHRRLFEREIHAPPASHVLAFRELNTAGKRVVHVEIAGGAKPFVYVYDDADTREERLRLLHPPLSRIEADKNTLYETPLSRQAIGRSSRVTAPPTLLLTAVDVSLVAQDEHGDLRVTETMVPQQALSVLRFDQRSIAIYDINRASRQRKYEIKEITDGRGRKLAFDHRAGQLLVSLAETAAAATPLQLTFEISGDFLYRPQGSNYWELGIDPWFPWTEWNGQRYSYHALIKVKKPFVPFTTGKTVRRESSGDFNLLETRVDQPISAVAILAGRYEFDEETRNGVTVRVASFMSRNATAFKQLSNIAFAAIESMPSFLGPFPFDELNIIEKNELGYGQAPPGLVFITKEAFRPKMEEENEYVKGVNLRFVHEIAHQYWGNVVRMPSFEEQWLEEAFAEYSAALFLKSAGRAKDYENAMNRWKADASQSTSVASIPMANRLDNPNDELSAYEARVNLLYGKGPVLLAALHKELGDQMFLTFLKSYQKSFRFKFGTTKDVAGLLQFLTKKDFGPFFEKYYWGTEMPR